MTTAELIQTLESKGLLPPELIRELREALAKTPQLSPRKVIRSLVKAGHLSAFQGEELLGRSVSSKGGSSQQGVDDLEVIDDLPEIPSGGPPHLPPSLPPAGQSSLLPGSLESLMQSASLGPAMGSFFGAAAPEKKAPASVWESKLILIGGGSLAVLMLMAVALYFLISRGTGEEAFAAAEKEYSDGHYSQAVTLYDQYLERFPDHPKVGLGRVHRAMCLIRRSTEGAKGEGWVRAWEETKPVIDSILSESSVPEVRADIAAVLQNIVDGLAAHAEARTDAPVVKLCREVIEVARDPQYVPTKNRDEQRLLRAEGRLARADRDLDRGSRLQVVVEAIKQEADKGDVAKAYAIRKALVKDYPDMASNPDLLVAIRSASQKEQELVKFVAEERAAEMKDVERPTKTILLPSTTVKSSPAGMAGQTICTLAEGAAYALDAATGKVLWRRFVGFDAPSPPTRIGPPSGGDLLLVDSQSGELVRVVAATGQLRWRLALPGLKVAPTAIGNQVWVPGGEGAKGRLYTVDLESGKCTGHIELPQPVRSPATADADGKLVFQVSEHSNLYVIDVATRTCKMVFYLGHEPGVIVAPPVLAGPYVIVTENRQAKVSWVRVLKREENEEGQQIIRQLQEVRVDGHIPVPPLVIGRSLIVSTDLGGVFLFDLSPTNPKEPLIKGPLKPSSLAKRRTTYVHMRGSRLWVGNNQFASYDVQLAGGQLLARWVTDEGSEFLQPFHTSGDVIFHVRAVTGKPGVIVTAAQMDEREIYWETRLAATPAGGALLDRKRGELTLLMSDGLLFQNPLAALAANQAAAAPASAARVDPAPAVDAQPIALSESRWAFVSAGERSRVLAYAPAETGPILRWVKLPDMAGGLPVALAGKLVVPGAAGVVFSFDPFSGQFGPAPFLPSVDGGREFQWRVSDLGGQKFDQSDVLLFDGRPKRSRLFRLSVQNEPSEHLGALTEVATSQQLASSLARTDKRAYAVNAVGELVAFELSSLRLKWNSRLLGQLAWGPRTIGSRAMLLVEPQPYDEVHLKSGEVLKVQPITASLPENPLPELRLTVQLLDPPETGAAAKSSAGKSGSKSAGDLARKSASSDPAGKQKVSKEKVLPPGTRVIPWGEIDHLRRFDEISAEIAPHRLLCLDDQSDQPLWSLAWRYGALAGDPVSTKEGGFLAASVSGVVVRLSPKGEELGRTDLRQPLASGPVLLDEKQLAFAGRDGTLHVVAIP